VAEASSLSGTRFNELVAADASDGVDSRSENSGDLFQRGIPCEVAVEVLSDLKPSIAALNRGSERP
jgi:hypothetical protein